MGAPGSAFHKALRRHLGWSIEEERSGTSVQRERLSRSGNRHARRELRSWAWCLVKPQAALDTVSRLLRAAPGPAVIEAAGGGVGAPVLQAHHRPVALHDQPAL